MKDSFDRGLLIGLVVGALLGALQGATCGWWALLTAPISAAFGFALSGYIIGDGRPPGGGYKPGPEFHAEKPPPTYHPKKGE